MQRAKGGIWHLLLITAFLTIQGTSADAGSFESDKTAAPPPRTSVKPPPGFTEACSRYDWLCESTQSARRGLKAAEIVKIARSINRRVNRMFTHITDAENYGRADFWTLPNSRGGDCEDFVLEKYRRLIAAGVSSRDISIAVVRWRQENHAVLVLHHESGDLVLDSLTSSIQLWNETNYRYLAMQTRDDQSTWAVVANRPKDRAILAQR